MGSGWWAMSAIDLVHLFELAEIDPDDGERDQEQHHQIGRGQDRGLPFALRQGKCQRYRDPAP